MYANQRVRIKRKGEPDEVLSAHFIEIARTGRIRVHLDDPNGENWNYANPIGVRDLPHGTRVTIETDF